MISVLLSGVGLAGCSTTPTTDAAPTSTVARGEPGAPSSTAVPIGTTDATVDRRRTSSATALIDASGNASTGAVDSLVATSFTDHDPSTDGSRSAFLTAWANGPRRTPVRTLIDGDLVGVHSTSGGPSADVHFDLFRVDAELVVEHWSAHQSSAAPNPAGRTLVDGPTDITDRDRTTENRKLVQRLMTEVFGVGAFDQFPTFTKDGAYLQHNPALGDGVAAIQGLMASLSPPGGAAFRYHATHKVVADGNFVLAQSEGRIGSSVVAYYDLFRVADGAIAEHWDVVAPVPPGSVNPNPPF